MVSFDGFAEARLELEQVSNEQHCGDGSGDGEGICI